MVERRPKEKPDICMTPQSLSSMYISTNLLAQYSEKTCIGIETLALVRRFGLGKGWISPWPRSLILSLGGVYALWFLKGSTALNTLNTAKHWTTEHEAMNTRP